MRNLIMSLNQFNYNLEEDENIVLLHLSNNKIIICQAVSSTNSILTTRMPMELIIKENKNGEIDDIFVKPYLFPFAELNLENLVPFNQKNICSISKSSKLTIDYYKMALEKISQELLSEKDSDSDLEMEQTSSEQQQQNLETFQNNTYKKSKITIH